MKLVGEKFDHCKRKHFFSIIAGWDPTFCDSSFLQHGIIQSFPGLLKLFGRKLNSSFERYWELLQKKFTVNLQKFSSTESPSKGLPVDSFLKKISYNYLPLTVPFLKVVQRQTFFLTLHKQKFIALKKNRDRKHDKISCVSYTQHWSLQFHTSTSRIFTFQFLYTYKVSILQSRFNSIILKLD